MKATVSLVSLVSLPPISTVRARVRVKQSVLSHVSRRHQLPLSNSKRKCSLVETGVGRGQCLELSLEPKSSSRRRELSTKPTDECLSRLRNSFLHGESDVIKES